MPRISIHILPLLFLPLLLLSLNSCSQVPPSPSGAKMTPQVSTGKKIPDLTLLDSRGDRVDLYPLLQKANKTALVFYRGYW